MGNDSNLYIDGNLTMSGYLSGVGNVYVSGQSDLYGSSLTVDGSEQMSLYSRGPVFLPKGPSTTFQGLVFTNGFLYINGTAAIPAEVRGGLFAADDSSQNSQVVGLVTIEPGDIVADQGLDLTWVGNFAQ